MPVRDWDALWRLHSLAVPSAPGCVKQGKKMLQHLSHLLAATLCDRKGATSLEYGVFAALLIAALTAAFTAFQTDLISVFSALSDALRRAF
jgi:Flp pilus assembly pilin Flp